MDQYSSQEYVNGYKQRFNIFNCIIMHEVIITSYKQCNVLIYADFRMNNVS